MQFLDVLEGCLLVGGDPGVYCVVLKQSGRFFLLTRVSVTAATLTHVFVTFALSVYFSRVSFDTLFFERQLPLVSKPTRPFRFGVLGNQRSLNTSEMIFLDKFLQGLKPQFDDDAVDRLNYYYT